MPDGQHQPHKADRRQDLILAAFRLIAEKGFEGFRVRDVAAHVGLNGATLHYYFPTKEDLIAAVVGYTIDRLRTLVAQPASTQARPRDQLRQHLTRLYGLMKAEPELFIVLTEITVRARRTPGSAFLVEQNERWHDLLQDIFQRGADCGDWPKELNAHAAAWSVMTLMEGVSLHAAEIPLRTDKVMAELFAWIEAGGS